MSSRPPLPRPLTSAERDVLLAVIGARDFPGRDALQAQVPLTSVVGYCECPCATVDLAVDPTAPVASEAPRPIPVDVQVHDENGDPLGGILVFATEGRLSLLEVYSYEGPIVEMPPVERLRFTL